MVVGRARATTSEARPIPEGAAGPVRENVWVNAPTAKLVGVAGPDEHAANSEVDDTTATSAVRARRRTARPVPRRTLRTALGRAPRACRRPPWGARRPPWSPANRDGAPRR